MRPVSNTNLLILKSHIAPKSGFWGQYGARNEICGIDFIPWHTSLGGLGQIIMGSDALKMAHFRRIFVVINGGCHILSKHDDNQLLCHNTSNISRRDIYGSTSGAWEYSCGCCIATQQAQSSNKFFRHHTDSWPWQLMLLMSLLWWWKKNKSIIIAKPI